MQSLEIIKCMYEGLPFKDENGKLVYISDTFDCLINSCEIFEKTLFKSPNKISSEDYHRFLEYTLHYLESIDIQEFREKAKKLERSVREIILRNLDKINLEYPEEVDISQYVLALL